MTSYCVKHVFVRDTLFTCTRLDAHNITVATTTDLHLSTKGSARPNGLEHIEGFGIDPLAANEGITARILWAPCGARASSVRQTGNRSAIRDGSIQGEPVLSCGSVGRLRGERREAS